MQRTNRPAADNLAPFFRKFPRKLSFPPGIDRRRLHPPSSAVKSERSPYLLLFRNTGAENYRHLSPQQRQDVVQRWNVWFESLVAQGKAVEGQPLEDETRVVAGPGGARITDGPFPETKEAIGGYVKLLVRDLDEATDIARRHPGLDYGLIVEVRAMTPDCHLGVNTKPSEVHEGAQH